MAAAPRYGGADDGCVVVNEARVVRFDDNVRHGAVAEGDKIESECLFGVLVNTWLARTSVSRMTGRLRS
jgi:L-arabinose isomerase